MHPLIDNQECILVLPAIECGQSFMLLLFDSKDTFKTKSIQRWH